MIRFKLTSSTGCSDTNATLRAMGGKEGEHHSDVEVMVEITTIEDLHDLALKFRTKNTKASHELIVDFEPFNNTIQVYDGHIE